MAATTETPAAASASTSGGSIGADTTNSSNNSATYDPLLPTSYNNATAPWFVNPTFQPHQPPSSPYSSCQWNSSFTIVASCLAVVFLLFGILLTFFGYRLFKLVMFLTGFVFSSVLVYMILEQEDLIPPEANLGVAAGAGILLALITMLIRPAGIFVTGLNVGVALVICGLVAVEQFTHPCIKWIPIGVLLGVGVFFGLLALWFQKGMTILGTSILGSAIGVAGMDYFVEQSRMALYMWDRVLAQWSSSLCWYSWLMFGLWPAFALLGIILQWKVTGVGMDHRLALRSRREQTEDVQLNRARQKRETQQSRYRHLYHARRIKGDVISQNFLHSIQDKLSPDMRSLTTLNSEPINEEESTATTTLTQVT